MTKIFITNWYNTDNWHALIRIIKNVLAMWGCKIQDIDYIIVRETEALIILNTGVTYEYIFDREYPTFDKLNFLRMFGEFVSDPEIEIDNETFWIKFGKNFDIKFFE